MEELTNAITRLNRELVALKVSVQDKDTALSQLERERNSLREDVEHMRRQIQSYSSDFEAERRSREQITVENGRLNQKIKELELDLTKTRDNFMTERTIKDLENERLKQDLETCKAEHAAEKAQLLHQIQMVCN